MQAKAKKFFCEQLKAEAVISQQAIDHCHGSAAVAVAAVLLLLPSVIKRAGFAATTKTCMPAVLFSSLHSRMQLNVRNAQSAVLCLHSPGLQSSPEN